MTDPMVPLIVTPEEERLFRAAYRESLLARAAAFAQVSGFGRRAQTLRLVGDDGIACQITHAVAFGVVLERFVRAHARVDPRMGRLAIRLAAALKEVIEVEIQEAADQALPPAIKRS